MQVLTPEGWREPAPGQFILGLDHARRYTTKAITRVVTLPDQPVALVRSTYIHANIPPEWRVYATNHIGGGEIVEAAGWLTNIHGVSNYAQVHHAVTGWEPSSLQRFSNLRSAKFLHDFHPASATCSYRDLRTEAADTAATAATLFGYKVALAERPGGKFRVSIMLPSHSAWVKPQVRLLPAMMEVQIPIVPEGGYFIARWDDQAPIFVAPTRVTSNLTFRPVPYDLPRDVEDAHAARLRKAMKQRRKAREEEDDV